MHKGVILLVEATSREHAYIQAENFLEQYGNGVVWDWWSLGNRWNNELAPKKKLEDFRTWVQTEYFHVFKDGFYSISDLESEPTRSNIQKKWEELGMIGKNPYYSGYGFDLNSGPDTEDYNIIPLKDCIETVKDWCKNLKEESEKIFGKILEAKEEAKEGKYDMSGYYAGIYKDLYYGNFSFESNVYDITTDNAEKIPDNTDNYWAVMIDMHN